MVDKGYMSLHDVSLAEKEINSIAEELVKSLMDRGYDLLEIIDIFSNIFDKDQVRRFIGLHIGMKKLESLEESEKKILNVTHHTSSTTKIVLFYLYFNLPNSSRLAQIDCPKLKLCLNFPHPFGGVHAQFPFFARYHASDLLHEYS